MSIQIYHNPKCSKSRAALKLLQDAGCNPNVVHYLKTPPSSDDLHSLCELLEMHPADLARKGESRFQELNLANEESYSARDWCKILSENPILIERPIVTDGSKAVIGRPPERVKELLK